MGWNPTSWLNPIPGTGGSIIVIRKPVIGISLRVRQAIRRPAIDMPDSLFARRFNAAQAVIPFCVGLDPDPERLPVGLNHHRRPLLEFSRAIMDATCRFTRAFKFQFAHYASVGAEADLQAAIRHLRDRCPEHLVILDAKRGDISATSACYAREAFDRYDADAVTVSPYLGFESLQPFFVRPDRGAFVICRTTNSGSEQFQSRGEPPLYLQVAAAAARQSGKSHNVGLVAGANRPEELAAIRALAPGLPILAPGIGAQGGDVREALLAASHQRFGAGILLSASRSILFAGSGKDYASAAAQAAEAFYRRIKAVLAE